MKYEYHTETVRASSDLELVRDLNESSEYGWEILNAQWIGIEEQDGFPTDVYFVLMRRPTASSDA